MSLPSQAYLLKCLIYYPLTGLLVWRERPQEHFSDALACERWNRTHADIEAFSTPMSNGYVCGTLDGVNYLAHRVIWKMLHGTEPEHIDHDDGVRSNNSESNLIESNAQLNAKNTGMSSRNKSGVTGVTWVAKRKQWRAQISIGNKRNKHIGYYPTLEQAKDARTLALAHYHYSVRHGK